MNIYSRRAFLSLSGGAAFLGTNAIAANPFNRPSSPLLSCGSMMATPEIKRVESDIEFEMAYLDTTPRYHGNALLLSELALDDLEDDDRVTTIADQILEQHPENLEFMKGIREELYGDAEMEEATHEKMTIAMGGMESCSDESHMNFLDAEWVEETFTNHDDPYLAYVSMLVLLLEMEHHQHAAGVELTEHDELHHFCVRMVEEYEAAIAVLKDVRGELLNRY